MLRNIKAQRVNKKFETVHKSQVVEKRVEHFFLLSNLGMILQCTVDLEKKCLILKKPSNWILCGMIWSLVTLEHR